MKRTHRTERSHTIPILENSIQIHGCFSVQHIDGSLVSEWIRRLVPGMRYLRDHLAVNTFAQMIQPLGEELAFPAKHVPLAQPDGQRNVVVVVLVMLLDSQMTELKSLAGMRTYSLQLRRCHGRTPHASNQPQSPGVTGLPTLEPLS